MNEDELKDILKILTIIEKRMQKILYENEKEQTECKSECSKTKIEEIKRELNNLLLILEEIEKTPVAGTTDVVMPIKDTSFINKMAKDISKNLTNHGIHEEQSKSFRD